MGVGALKARHAPTCPSPATAHAAMRGCHARGPAGPARRVGASGARGQAAGRVPGVRLRGAAVPRGAQRRAAAPRLAPAVPGGVGTARERVAHQRRAAGERGVRAHAHPRRPRPARRAQASADGPRTRGPTGTPRRGRPACSGAVPRARAPDHVPARPPLPARPGVAGRNAGRGGRLAPLFHPVVVVALVGSLLAADTWLVRGSSLDTAVADTLRTPPVMLLLLAILLGSTLFHEFGHAAACRYGGATRAPSGWPCTWSTRPSTPT